MNDADKLAQQCAESMFQQDQASPALGIKIQTVRAGYAEMTMKIEPWMANGGGVCHGGLIFSLADTAMAFASNSHNQQMVAMNASIEFVAAGKIGEQLTATASEAHRAGRTGTYDVAVRDARGALIAKFLGRTYQVRGRHVDAPVDN